MSDEQVINRPASSHAFGRRTLLRGGLALGLGVASSAASASLADARSPGRHIPLAMRGTTHYRIYIGTAEDAVVQQAASELSQYLEQITGAAYEVVISDTPPDNPALIVVGRNNPLSDEIGASIDYDGLGDDGFAYRTRGLTVMIVGPSSRGALYGAYWLLDHVAGVRWYASDYTYVPDNPDLLIPLDQVNGDHVPRFRYRQLYVGDADDPAYRQHNLLNWIAAPDNSVRFRRDRHLVELLARPKLRQHLSHSGH